MYYQLRRIHKLRESTTTAEAIATLNDLKHISHDTVSQVRSFWDEILSVKTQVSLHALRALRLQTMRARTEFSFACQDFPNNVDLFRELAIYQIEAASDFRGAVETGISIARLEQGRLVTVDFVFRPMVNVFPDYLLLNIVDESGNFTNRTSEGGPAQPAGTGKLSGSSFDPFDHKYDEVMGRLFDHGRLRLALQERMLAARIPSRAVARVLAVLRRLS
jgi:hypothetical protein